MKVGVVIGEVGVKWELDYDVVGFVVFEYDVEFVDEWCFWY